MIKLQMKTSLLRISFLHQISLSSLTVLTGQGPLSEIALPDSQAPSAHSFTIANGDV